jgi:DNA-binding IclR family transcriptional regulator
VSAGSKPILVLGKARRIMDAFAADGGELTFTEVRSRSQLPASTCLRLLDSLTAEGFLDRTGDRYRPGLRLVAWASSALAGVDLVRQATPILEGLRDETGETACLYVRHGRVRTCVALAETRHAVAFRVRVGQVMTMHAGAGGKVFLAFDEELRREVLAAPLTQYTDATTTDPRRLLRELEQVRGEGYASSFGERNEGAGSMSAPVFDATGAVVASVGIVAPAQRLTADTAARWAPAVTGAAASLSAVVSGARLASAGAAADDRGE